MPKEEIPLKINLGINYPAREAAAMFFGAVAYGGAYACFATMMPVAMAVTAACLAIGGVVCLRPAMQQTRFEAQLIGDRRPYLLHSELVKINRDAASVGARWVGYGFQWGTPQCQAVQEFLKSDWKNAYHCSLTRAMRRRYLRTHLGECIKHPLLTTARLRTQARLVATQPGFRWCHAMGKEESKFVRDRKEAHV